MTYRNSFFIFVLFLFVITSCSDKDKEEITRLVTEWQGKEINTRNHFPKKDMFHTFLLDADNKVQVIGNPIHNNAVKELYLKTLSQ